MTMTRTEGNVIHADFGGKPKPQPMPLLSAHCEILYQDGEVVLTRTQVQVGDEAWVTHGLYPIG